MPVLKYIEHSDKEKRIQADVEYAAKMLNNRVNRRTGFTEATFRIETGPKNDDAKFGMADFAFLDLLDELEIDADDITKTSKLTVKFALNEKKFFDLIHIEITS